jgi:hypothetical protein
MNVLIRNDCGSVTLIAALLAPYKSIWAQEVERDEKHLFF